MRLTVHVANAVKEKVEVRSTDKPGTNKKEVIKNTFSFSGVLPSDVDRILKEIESNKLGIPFKHYFSQEKIIGRARGKKK